MKELWRKYTTKLFRSYGRNQGHLSALDLKKDIIFKYTLTILLPLSTIAFGPGIVYSFHVDLPYLGIADILALISLITITLPIRIPLQVRKVIFMFIAYFIAIVAIWYVGMLGPGLILLLAACLLGIVFFSNKTAIYFAHLNLILLVLFAILLSLDYFQWRNFIVREHIIEEWIAVAGNVILMSYLFAFIIPYVFKKMQSTLNEEHRLKEKLELKQLELEKTLSILHRKNEELEQFAYIASHDLQEPLRMVSSFMEKIDQKYGDILDEKGKTYLHFAVDGSKRMRKMIVDLLEYSRFQRSDNVAEIINLNEILKIELELFHEQIKATNTTLIIEQLPSIVAPKSSITSLFQNLISNALKYRKLDVPLLIEISCQENEKDYLFSVKDNGIGIDEKYHSKVFTIFQRLHREDEISGSGIGLAICKKIISDLDGTIWFESNSVDGTNFLFKLPK
jgi:signal transduction histidine kinase